jgi:hypothetical protein
MDVRQLFLTLNVQRTVKQALTIVTTVAITSAICTFFKPSLTLDKFILLYTGTLLSFSSKQLFTITKDLDGTAEDLTLTSRKLMIEALKREHTPVKHKNVETKDDTPKVEEQMITDVVSYWLKELRGEQHIMLIGGTGAGKSEFIKRFTKKLKSVQTVVYDLHATVDDWSFADSVYHDVDDIRTQMLHDMQVVTDEMAARRVQGSSYSKNNMLIVADEFPALVAAYSEEAKGNKKSTVQQWISKLARESRKIGVMMCVIVQADTVENTGLKGSAQLKDSCFMKVYLGKSAYERAKALGNEELQVIFRDDNSFTYCLVDDRLAYRP